MKNWNELVPRDILEANVPDGFFGDNVVRANIVRVGTLNGFDVQSRVLQELKQRDPNEMLVPGNNQYNCTVQEKIEWTEDYLDRCIKQFEWFEKHFGSQIRAAKSAAVEAVQENKEPKEVLGTYNANIGDM